MDYESYTNMFSHAPAPAFSTIENRLIIPDPPMGTDERALGQLAARVKTLPWTIARKANFVKSDFLKFLRTKEPRREPTLRPVHECDRWGFDEQVGMSIENVEAIYIQTVGRWTEEECTHCQQEDGPFVNCVVVDAIGWPKECANCHWGGKARQCSHFVEPRDCSVDQELARQRASDRRDFVCELNTLLSITEDLRIATTRTRQAGNDNLTAWNRVTDTAQGLRSRLRSGDLIRSSDIRRVREQVTAGVSRGNTVRSAEHEVRLYRQNLQRALNDLIRQYSE